MKAIRYYRYGSSEVLQLHDVNKPAISDNQALVRVRAASVNPLDVAFMRGTPYVVRAQTGPFRPRVKDLGADMAGQVQAVGKNVTRFRPGDEVFGSRRGTFAEYISIPDDAAVAAKPASLTFEQAAAMPLAGFTALQALRDKGRIRPGQKVLVNGASGGVGTFAVQIAKAFGAEVTGVCSPRNVDMVASIGADHVIDYTRQDFTRTSRRYDLLVDMAGSRTLAECRRVLTPQGILVVVGGPDNGQWIAPLIGLAKVLMLSAVVSQTMTPMLARQRAADLAVLRELVEEGKVTPVIDRTYPLSEVPHAIGYLEQGHARGKVVITI